MPYIPNTPEALIGRSDSKDPSTTCRGITSEGRPCRRSLAGSSRSRHSVTPARGHALDGAQLDPAAGFCWQHKNQAIHIESRVTEHRQQRQTIVVQRTSIDTLVDRLGVLNVEDNAVKKSKKQKADSRRSKKGQDVPSSSANDRPAQSQPARRPMERPPRRGGQSSLSILCCMSSEYESDQEMIRPRRHEKRRDGQGIPSGHGRISSGLAGHNPPMTESNIHATSSSSMRRVPEAQEARQASNRPKAPKDPPSQTEQLLSFIPTSLSPQITSLLLAELAKPFSDADEEGYIYMFCLTDPKDAAAAAADSESVAEVASTVLDTPRTPRGQKTKDISTDKLLDNIAIPSPNSNHDRKSILLKIGRASNVHRRMNEWSRQCGYELSLVRFYPHISNAHIPGTPSAPSSPPASPAAKAERYRTSVASRG